MSDTPRTDSECKDICGDAYMRSVQSHGDYVSADFARQLERELASVTKGSLELEEEKDELDREFQDLERKWKESEKRVKQLEHALSLVVPKCDYLHHPKKYQHKITEPCPVEELIRKAQNI